MLQLAGSSNRRLDGPSSAEGSNADDRRGTMDGEAGNATISKATENGGEENSRGTTVEGGSRNRRLGHEKTALLTGTAKRIQFEESEDTEEDALKDLTEEERKTRRRRANLMALVKRASNKSQS